MLLSYLSNVKITLSIISFASCRIFLFKHPEEFIINYPITHCIIPDRAEKFSILRIDDPAVTSGQNISSFILNACLFSKRISKAPVIEPPVKISRNIIFKIHPVHISCSEQWQFNETVNIFKFRIQACIEPDLFSALMLLIIEFIIADSYNRAVEPIYQAFHSRFLLWHASINLKSGASFLTKAAISI